MKIAASSLILPYNGLRYYLLTIKPFYGISSCSNKKCWNQSLKIWDIIQALKLNVYYIGKVSFLNALGFFSSPDSKSLRLVSTISISAILIVNFSLCDFLLDAVISFEWTNVLSGKIFQKNLNTSVLYIRSRTKASFSNYFGQYCDARLYNT